MSSSSDSDVMFTLRANRQLLDPNFDRYILRNERMQAWKTKLPISVRNKVASVNQWGYQQIKAHTLADRLVVDHACCHRSTISLFMLLQNRSLISLHFDYTAKRWTEPLDVACLASSSLGEEAFPETLHFLNDRFAATSNGSSDGFSIWYTGDRSNGARQPWKEVFKYDNLELHGLSHEEQQQSVASANGMPFPTIVLDARSSSSGEFEVLFLAVLQTEKKEKADERVQQSMKETLKNSCFRAHLIWMTVAAAENVVSSDENAKFVVRCQREVSVNGGKVEFACFDAALQCLVVFSTGPAPTFVWDSTKPILTGDGEKMAEDGEGDVRVAGDKTMETIGTDSETSAMEGVQPTASEDNRQQFNAEQLEECDRLPEVEDDVSAFWLDGNSHRLIHMAVINELLFTARLTANRALCFATRYDVDAVVWSIENSTEKVPVSHLFTLNAFGFIQAGHQDKRFLGCSPDGRYATLINRANHAFLYLQNSALSDVHDLKNRRTGKRAESIAKQLVLSMNAVDPDWDPSAVGANEFLGFYAGGDILFLLTHDTVYAVEVPS